MREPSVKNLEKPISVQEFTALTAYLRGRGSMSLSSTRNLIGTSANGRPRGEIVTAVLTWVRSRPKKVG